MYGVCIACQKLPVSIPGLDANYCDRCGWVEDPIYKQRRIAIDAARREQIERDRQARREQNKLNKMLSRQAA